MAQDTSTFFIGPSPAPLTELPLATRVANRIRARAVAPERVIETPDSQLIFGRTSTEPVVLKVIKRRGDEWFCGEMLQAFGGNGMVRVLAFEEGAVLLERLEPGTSLSEMALSGDDAGATEILADVMRRMNPGPPPASAVAVADLAEGFRRYLARGSSEIPRALVEHAQQVYLDLCASQTRPRLLHGDLHHDNVLFDRTRGWVAIDPKGLIGEPEYEIGAALRNPYERPELFASPQVIEQRLKSLSEALGLDGTRVLRWAFAQAVLAMIWSVEEGDPVDARYPFLVLAQVMESMIRG
jgi:streptomycin 6-kinase